MSMEEIVMLWQACPLEVVLLAVLAVACAAFITACTAALILWDDKEVDDIVCDDP